MQFHLNEFKNLVSLTRVSFQHVSRSANGMVDVQAKHGVDCLCNLSVFVL